MTNFSPTSGPKTEVSAVVSKLPSVSLIQSIVTTVTSIYRNPITCERPVGNDWLDDDNNICMNYVIKSLQEHKVKFVIGEERGLFDLTITCTDDEVLFNVVTVVIIPAHCGFIVEVL